MHNDPKLGSVWSYVGHGTEDGQDKIITIKLIAKDQRGSYLFENLVGKAHLSTYSRAILNKVWYAEDPNDIMGSKYWRKNKK